MLRETKIDYDARYSIIIYRARVYINIPIGTGKATENQSYSTLDYNLETTPKVPPA